MLFSNPEVAAFIRENFHAAWESIRPVPVVTIDFGNGKTLKRTLNGNVATYLCAPDGRVIDVIPGLVEPKAYLRELRAGMELWRTAERNGFDATVLAHHRSNPAPRFVPELDRRDYAKARIETPVREMTEEDRLLAADTRLNLVTRKPLIHKLLSEKIVRPADVCRRLYRDVLHCDLDDPYLGLAVKAFGGGAY